MPAKRALGEQKRQNDIFKTLIIAKNQLITLISHPIFTLKTVCQCLRRKQ